MGAIALAAGAGVVMVVGDPPRAAAAPEVVSRTASGTWIVDGHGFGHGRGMSQHGARAAAVRGLSAERILGFYYPGTTRASIGNPMIRVLVNDAAQPFVQLRPIAGLRVGWTGRGFALPALAGVQRWQVAAWGGTLRMRYFTRTGWHWYGPALPATVTLAASRGVVRVFRADRTATDYRGTLVVTRVGSVSRAVNRLPMESYLRGVVPRESPASWPLQALRAQAVAARTYAYARLANPLSSRYDICRTTACQVYGGATNYRTNGTRLSGEQSSTDTAVRTTAGVILRYAGRTAATEYSSSHGGWIAYGGRAYLPAKKDPYTAGDPYASWSVRVKTADVGRYFGFRRLDRIQVTSRDGAGAYGGRVLGATLTGIDGAGKPRALAVTGSALRNALGVRSNYLRIRTG